MLLEVTMIWSIFPYNKLDKETEIIQDKEKKKELKYQNKTLIEQNIIEMLRERSRKTHSRANITKPRIIHAHLKNSHMFW